MTKQTISFLTALLLLAAPLLALANDPPLERYEQLPAAFQAFQPEGYGFMDGIRVEGGVSYLLFHNGSDYYLFILRKDAAGAWQLVVKNNRALPPGNIRYTLSSDNPRSLYVRENEARIFSFSNRDGSWKLAGYFHATADAEMGISYQDDKIVFSQLSDGTKATVYGVYQRQLRYLDISTIPFTARDARQRLSQAPVIPAGGLQAERIHFTSGERFPVYSGPGEQYVRGAQGKAMVSTNDWIQVFGVTDGWAMIQYDITATHMRIGYIDAAALPKNARVGALALYPQSKLVGRSTQLTDDPLFSKESILQLKAGGEVTQLSTLGTDWTYVEVQSGDSLLRGFVPAASLMDKPSLGRLALGPGETATDEQGFAQYQARAILRRAGEKDIQRITVYAILPEEWKTPAPGVDALIGYRLYEGNQPSRLLKSQSDFQGLAVFSLEEAWTTGADVLGLVPLFALSGEKPEESLILLMD